MHTSEPSEKKEEIEKNASDPLLELSGKLNPLLNLVRVFILIFYFYSLSPAIGIPLPGAGRVQHTGL